MASRDLVPRRHRGRRLAWRRDHAEQLGSKAAERCLLAVPGQPVIVTTDTAGGQTVGGVATCGQVGFCPWCAPMVRQNRGDDIAALVEAAEAKGLSLWFATFTMPHDAGQSLSEVRAAFADAWREFGKREWVKRSRSKAGVVGYVRAFEVTWSEGAGWHFHCHMLIVVDERSASIGLVEMLVAGWRRGFDDRGWRWVPHVSLDVRLAGSRHQRRNGERGRAAAEYLAKTGMVWGAPAELARNDLKSGNGLNVGQILDLASCGDPEGVGLWAEYETACRGTRWIEWSDGLRSEAAQWQDELRAAGVALDGVRLDDIEMSDEEAAKGVLRAGVLHRVAVRAECWNLAVRQGKVGEFLDDVRTGQWSHLGLKLLVEEGADPPRLYVEAA